MSTLVTEPPGAADAPDLSARRGKRFAVDKAMTVLMAGAFVLVLIPIGLVVWNVISRGASVISWSFLTEDIPARSRSAEGGIYPAIIGTITITLAASLMAIPLGILGAVYLHEYGGNGLWPKTIRFLSNVMSGVPSIVMGLFVYLVYTLNFGLDGFGGSLALAALMLPIVMRSCEEMLRLVPDNLREGAYALGTRKSRTILTVVIPAALPGIVSGSLLAVARAAGETAPLVFTIGAARAVNWNLREGENTALSTLIFSNANSTFAASVDRAWGAALTLVVLTFLFTVAARIITRRFAIKMG